MTAPSFDFTTTDASASGVYMVAPIDMVSIDAAACDAGWMVRHVDLRGCDGKDAVLQQMTSALDAPDFGHSWSGLGRSLRDLSWLPAPGHALLFENGPRLRAASKETFDKLLDLLDETASERNTPFWAFFAMPESDFDGDD